MSDSSPPPDRADVFRALYESVYPDLLRFVQRRTDTDAAEDVVADAFLVLWRRFAEVPNHHDDARAWAFGITRNLLLNAHRGEQRRQALGLPGRTRIRSPKPPITPDIHRHQRRVEPILRHRHLRVRKTRSPLPTSRILGITTPKPRT
jgi:RNA polymerase sigma factor (sigma-70 family)